MNSSSGSRIGLELHSVHLDIQQTRDTMMTRMNASDQQFQDMSTQLMSIRDTTQQNHCDLAAETVEASHHYQSIVSILAAIRAEGRQRHSEILARIFQELPDITRRSMNHHSRSLFNCTPIQPCGGLSDSSSYETEESALGCAPEFPAPTKHRHTKSKNRANGELNNEPVRINFILQRTTVQCLFPCLCNCHSPTRTWRRRTPTSTLLASVLSQLFIGYSGKPVPVASCDVERCRNSSKRIMEVRYSFPAWLFRTVIQLVICVSSAGRPNLGVYLRRRLTYAGDDNAFLRVSSGDVEGAIALIQRQHVPLDDMDVCCGFSLAQVAMFNLRWYPQLIKVVHVLRRAGANPYLKNDQGEDDFQFMNNLAYSGFISKDTHSHLQSLYFSCLDLDAFEFSHIHKVVLGIRPLELSAELRKWPSAAHIDSRDYLGRTPLTLAALIGDDEAVEALLLAGADPNPKEPSCGWYYHSLISAARANNPRNLELLLMAGASPFATTIYGDTALEVACFMHDNPSMIKPLLIAGGSSSQRNQIQKHNALAKAASRHNTTVARYLIERGFDLNNRDWYGNTCLFEAIYMNSHNCIQLFLDSGADYTIVNDLGRTILHATALYGDTRTANILITSRLRNLDPESLDNNGRTPLEYLAVRQVVPEGFHEAFEKLVSEKTGDSPHDNGGGSITCSDQRIRHGSSIISSTRTLEICCVQEKSRSFGMFTRVSLSASCFLSFTIVALIIFLIQWPYPLLNALRST
jgi:ankyrin repeat protein